MQFEGKRVLITGASTGIGFQAAKFLVKEGATVFITGLPPETQVSEACHQIDSGYNKARYVTMDLANEQSVRKAVTQAKNIMGGIDILINNAGISTQSSVHDQSFTTAEKEIRINYLGTYLVTQLVLPDMIIACSGTIINVASTLGMVPGPTQANYAASKAAVIAFTSALRSELEDFGINVKLFVPGLTSTDMTKELKIRAPQLLTPEYVAKELLEAILNKRPSYVTGLSYRTFVWFSRIFPELSRKIMKGYYA